MTSCCCIARYCEIDINCGTRLDITVCPHSFGRTKSAIIIEIYPYSSAMISTTAITC